MVYRARFRFEGAGKQRHGRFSSGARSESNTYGSNTYGTAKDSGCGGMLADRAGWVFVLRRFHRRAERGSAEQLSTEKCSTADRSPKRNTKERNTKDRNTKRSTSSSTAEPSTRSARIRQSRADHSPAAACTFARRLPQHATAGRNRAANGEGHRLPAAFTA